MRKLFWGILLLVFISTASSYAGDAYIKGGLIIRPTDSLSASDRYLIDFGSDYSVGYMAALGWEVATAYYSQDFAGDKLRTVPINAFFNFKIISPNEGLRPFGKIGFGALTTVVNFKSNTDTSTMAGFHIGGGLQFSHFVAELQGEKRFKGGSPFTIILLGGFTW